MKILLATYWDIPHVGGVWNYMKQLRDKLLSLGHDVDILGYGDENKSIHIVNKGRKIEINELMPLLEANLNPSVYPAIHENPLVKYTEFQRYAFELGAAYLGIDEYDIIHTQDVISTSCIYRIKPEHMPLVATIHGSVANEINQQLETIHKTSTSFIAKKYFNELEYVGATRSEATIVANQWLKGVLTEQYGVPADHLTVSHYGFDTKDFLKKMQEPLSLRRPDNKKIIMFTGRLVELKGVHHLITALEQLKKKRNDWVCWIIGSGDKEEELKNQKDAAGLQDDIYFFGKRDNIPSLLNYADIYVLPSLLDNQPLSVIEAQIAGKAIIVSDAGGLPEMVEHEVTGLITPAANPEKLCENIDLLLENEQLRNSIATNAKKWGLTHWSIDKAITKLLTVYKQAISTKQRGKE